MKIERVHIGSLIKREVISRGIPFSSFAQAIGVMRQNIESKVFSKKGIDTELLSLISEQLDFNFFKYYKSDEVCNENNYNLNGIKEVKAFVTLQIGEERKEKELYFVFGEKENRVFRE